jgi:hypothetical protein
MNMIKSMFNIVYIPKKTYKPKTKKIIKKKQRELLLKPIIIYTLI